MVGMRSGVGLRSLLVLAVFGCLTPGVAAAQLAETERNASPSADEALHALDPVAREGLAWELADRWAPEAAQRGFPLDGWRAELVENLLRLDDLRLRQAADAPSYSELVRRVTGKTPLDGPQPTGSPALDEPVTRVLGDKSQNLTYYALTPCRIYDSRFASGGLAGPLQPSTTITLRTRATMSGQGGAADCGLPSVDAGAIVVSVTVIGYEGSGFVTAYPATAARPLIPTVLYGNQVVQELPTSSEPISIVTILQQCVNCGTTTDISVFTGLSATQVLVDVVGYFDTPSTPDNNVLRTEQLVAANTNFSVFSPACPTGWRLSGGGFLGPNFGDNFFIGGRPALLNNNSSDAAIGINNANSWLCQGRTGGVEKTIRCFAVCVRAGQ